MTTHDEIAKRLGLRTWAAFRAVIIRDYSECSSQVSTDLCQDIDRLLNEVARLETRLHHDCKGCPGCSSNDCPDALDVALNEVARLEGELAKEREVSAWSARNDIEKGQQRDEARHRLIQADDLLRRWLDHAPGDSAIARDTIKFRAGDAG